MEVSTFFFLFCIVFASVSCQSTCPNNACASSAECERLGGAGCRCTNLRCQFNSNPCSGGCRTDVQCREWSGNNACNCSGLICGGALDEM